MFIYKTGFLWRHNNAMYTAGCYSLLKYVYCINLVQWPDHHHQTPCLITQVARVLWNMSSMYLINFSSVPLCQFFQNYFPCQPWSLMKISGCHNCFQNPLSHDILVVMTITLLGVGHLQELDIDNLSQPYGS